MIQFEYSAFEEATVPVCSFVLRNNHISAVGQYLRLVDFRGGMEVQRQKFLEAVENPSCGFRYVADSDNFAKIPGSPVAYWVSAAILNAYDAFPSVANIFYPKKGMFTGQNDLFFREWYEVIFAKIQFEVKSQAEVRSSHYVPMNSGGPFRRWYGNRQTVII
jgi:hypothetical protein